MGATSGRPKFAVAFAVAGSAIGLILAVFNNLGVPRSLSIVAVVLGIAIIIAVFESRISHHVRGIEVHIGSHRIAVALGSVVLCLIGAGSFIKLSVAESNETAGQVIPVQATVEELPSASSWGPERVTFSIKSPAKYAVLNSIIDHPTHGDERNFVQVRHEDAPNSSYTDLLAVSPGDVLVVYVWVSNDAANNLQGLAATVQDLRANLIRNKLKDPEALGLSVVLSSLNAKDVWDSANLQSNQPITVDVLPGFGTMHTSEATFSIQDKMLLTEKGALLGSSVDDGQYPVGPTTDQKGQLGAGFLTFHVKVEAEVG